MVSTIILCSVLLVVLPCTIVGHSVVIGCREVAKNNWTGIKEKTNYHPSCFNFNLLLLFFPHLAFHDLKVKSLICRSANVRLRFHISSKSTEHARSVVLICQEYVRYILQNKLLMTRIQRETTTVETKPVKCHVMKVIIQCYWYFIFLKNLLFLAVLLIRTNMN